MRRAVRALRRRQIHPDAQPLRQLPRRQRRNPGPPPRRRWSISPPPIRARSWRCGGETLGYVSQFLRVVPRVPALRRRRRGLLARGVAHADAADQARSLLLRLNIPRGCTRSPPATFSGGEQQRVNLARGFIAGQPILLLDEPTASLDAENRAVVVGMIREAKARGHSDRRDLSMIPMSARQSPTDCSP